MRRALLTAVAVATALAALAIAALWWWGLPPAGDRATLATAAAAVPGDVDGLVVLASPTRLARWAAGHVQAAGLLLLADPAGRGAAVRLERAARAVAASAEGPVRLFWRGTNLAVAAEVPAAARQALAELAAGEDLAFSSDATSVTVSTSSDLLAGAPGYGPDAVVAGRSAALARVGVRWWWVDATRRGLTAASGTPPSLPGPGRSSWLATDRLDAVLEPLASLAATGPRHASLVARDGEGWGVALTGVRISATVRRLLGERDAGETAVEGPRHWQGLLGDVWADTSDGLALASAPAFLAALRARERAAEAGALRGADAAYLLARVARVADEVPGFGRTARDLRAASSLCAALRAARWRITRAGGIIVLEW